MSSRFRISISAAALLAATALGSSGAAAESKGGGPAASATHDFNNENGVHAVPSGHVSETALSKVGTAPAPVAAEPAAATVKLSSAPAPAEAPSQSDRSTIRLADASGPPEPGAATETAAPASAEDAPPAEAQPALAAGPAPPSLTVADAALAARPDEDAPPQGMSEEDAVYRRAAPPAAAEPPSDAPEPEASLQPVSDVHGAPPQPMGQHVAFPRRSAEAASAFDGYMHAVGAIDAGFRSGQGVAAALQKASAYDPRQLEEGMIAYGAMAAMQSPRFVYGVMDAAADGRTRIALIEQLTVDPEVAARLPGAAEAASIAERAILREARPVVDSGRAIKQASYDVQHQGWSVAKASDQPSRLAQAKALSAVRVSAGDADVARLLTQVSALAGDEAGAAGVSPVAAHSLALAALAILDGTESPDQGRLEPVTTEKISADCLKMAKLNLFQCLSVAGPEYEDVYCLGQHAVLDTGQCVAGGAAPLDAMLMAERPRMSRAPE